jgi:hypothetical protein
MFVIELVTWLLLSMVLVGIHVYLAKRPHEKPGLLMLTGVLFGLTGGLFGTVVRLRAAETGSYSVLALAFAGVATVMFLLLEWMSGHEHAGPKAS